jgi:hypothetical protein
VNHSLLRLSANAISFAPSSITEFPVMSSFCRVVFVCSAVANARAPIGPNPVSMDRVRKHDSQHGYILRIRIDTDDMGI